LFGTFKTFFFFSLKQASFAIDVSSFRQDTTAVERYQNFCNAHVQKQKKLQ